jgi:hypothetical protein
MKPQENWESKVLEIKTLNANGQPLKEAVQLHNWTVSMYRNYHRRLNLPRCNPRVYNTDIHYFSKIDTENKAYFLGFIYADGCIHSPTSNRSSKVLSIKVHEKDGYILDILSKDISPQRSKNIYKSSGLSDSKMAMYTVNSDDIYNDLFKLGVRERKSKECSLIFPSLPSDLMRHFVRGFLDGDGYISYRKDRDTCNVGFCSTSKEFLIEISKLFNFKWCLCLSNKKEIELGFQPIYSLTTESRKNVLFLKDYFYKNSNVFLQRKFDNINKVIAS